ncbi:MAG: LLM class F420-dependent oxidoreductase [Candidatus Woykebacteria bacterium]
MKVGIVIAGYDWPNIGPTLEKIAKTSEEVGFDSVWVVDHFFGMGDATEPMLESYTNLGFIAAVTKKVTIGAMVAGVIYRYPALLVKAATTLDVISGGRAYFGIGAAWYEREAVGLGFPFPPVKERFERLEETLQIAKQMWSGETKAFRGKHYQLEETINSPQPISKPHPPIIIGGGGEKKTLRLVAKYGDACNLFVKGGLNQVAHKLDVLKDHCQDVGRNYEEIEKTAYAGRDVTSNLAPSRLVDMCKSLAKMGIVHTIFAITDIDKIAPLETFGKEIIPAVKEF